MVHTIVDRIADIVQPVGADADQQAATGAGAGLDIRGAAVAIADFGGSVAVDPVGAWAEHVRMRNLGPMTYGAAGDASAGPAAASASAWRIRSMARAGSGTLPRPCPSIWAGRCRAAQIVACAAIVDPDDLRPSEARLCPTGPLVASEHGKAQPDATWPVIP